MALVKLVGTILGPLNPVDPSLLCFLVSFFLLLLLPFFFCFATQKFDTGKMIQPGVINDLAGYRRVVGKVDAAEVPGMTVDEAASSALRYMDIPGPTIATLTFFLLHGVLTEPQEQRKSAVLDGGTSTCVII